MFVNFLHYPKYRKHNKYPEKFDFSVNIGKMVAKDSSVNGSQPKTFSTGSKVFTVKDVINNPYTNTPAYIFEETSPEYYVNCSRCFVIDEREPMEVIEYWQKCGRCGGRIVTFTYMSGLREGKKCSVCHREVD